MCINRNFRLVICNVVVAILIKVIVVFLSKDDLASSIDASEIRVIRRNFYKNAAVTANGLECADIGRDILLRNGSAADAIIAVMFCDGVGCSHNMGLGGGFMMTIYTNATGKVEVLNARDISPAAANENMFERGNISSTIGGKPVAIPGELRGYEALHNKYGKLPWADLVQPTIEICRSGHLVSSNLAKVLRKRKDRILNEPSLSEVFINPETNDVWLEGDKIKRPKLAETLEIIAREGADALYNGTLTERFVKDIQDFDGIITKEDMAGYKVEWLEPVSINLGLDATLHTVPLPGSGHILAFIINALKGWIVPSTIDGDDEVDVIENGPVYWHRIVEVFKYAFAKRTGLGDPKFLPADKIQPLLNNLTSEDYALYLRSLIVDNVTNDDWRYYGAEFGILEDHGTAHISVVSHEGDAISAISTINFILGTFRRSQSTGIILNNEMDDFSYPDIENIYGVPPSPTNYPAPGKRPLSSMIPSIVVEKGCGVRFVIGAAGGTKITTQVALVILRHLMSGNDLQEAINMSRLHHQLIPMEIQHELDFDEEILAQLQSFGHNISNIESTIGFAVISGISKNRTSGYYELQLDKRSSGSLAGF